MDKYEFKMYEGNTIMIDRDVAKLQDEGWELAGQVATKYTDKDGLYPTRMIIPLKRKIKTKTK